MRGKEKPEILRREVKRITPRLCGEKLRLEMSSKHLFADHPRLCGESYLEPPQR